MQKNDIVKLIIDSYGDNGEGVGRVDGLAVFVPFTIIGEEVEAKIIMLKKSFAVGKLTNLLKPSEDRVEPQCSVFGKCGGCQLQHMNEKAQRIYKKMVVESKIKRLAKIDFEVSDIICGDKKFRYRNKLQLPLADMNGKLIGGFFAPYSHRIVEIDDCLLQDARSMQVFKALKNYANSNGVKGYTEQDHKGLLRHLVIRSNENALLITLVINGEKLPKIEKLIEELNKLGFVYGLYTNKNTDRTNVIFGNKFTYIYGIKQLTFVEDNLMYKVTPQSFLQVNEEIKERIYKDAITLNHLDKKDVVINAYAGAGLLTANFAKAAKMAIGVEIIKEATISADNLAKENNIENMRNITGDCAKVIPKLIAKLEKDNYSIDDIGTINSPNSSDNENSSVEIKTKSNKKIKVSENCEDEAILDDAVLYVGNSSLILSANEKSKNEDKEGKPKNTSQNLIVTLDPPRKGVDQEVLSAVLESAPPRIVYISCNPATLSRDISLLSPKYEPTFITPYDMFPQTSHIETLVCLARK